MREKVESADADEPTMAEINDYISSVRRSRTRKSAAAGQSV